MNYFPIAEGEDPTDSAKLMCDQHVSNQQRETAQMLSTAVWSAWSEQVADLDIYRPTHANNPCSIWTRSSWANFCWAYDHARALWQEHKFRMGTDHASYLVSLRCYEFVRDLREARNLSICGPGTTDTLPMPRCFTDEFRATTTLDLSVMRVYEAYRAYYRFKHSLWKGDRRAMRYTNRPKPEWLL
jgi:hypothetical protein